jgi:L-fuconolactonase
VQAEPDGFLDGAEFNRGIAALRGTDLVYDILIFARQLAEATRFVDRHPQQVFVLDHIAKPSIATGEIAQWSAGIRELARRDNVVCKLSGMVTEADWKAWSLATLQPCFDTVLEAFGPARLMAGSDWPVLTVACSYSRWWQTIAEWTAPLSAAERHEIEAGTAIRTYRLDVQEEDAP